MASQWKTFQRFAEQLVFGEGPKLIRTLQHPIKVGLETGLNILAGAAPEPSEATASRPVTHRSVPTAQRARRLVYGPNLAGRADPGEVVWTWLVHDDDPSRGSDRPVLVVGRDQSILLGLVLSDQDHHHEANWIAVDSASWDYEQRYGWVRMDRVVDVPEEGIRREGAVLARDVFDVVASRLRRYYSWS
jgi:hypothetical protein